MKQNITQKIIAQHLLSGNMVAGEEISIRIDHTLTHDVTGTPAYLAFETLGIPQVKTERSVSYIDHNMLYTDNKKPGRPYLFTDRCQKTRHLFIQSRKRYLPYGALRTL